MNWFNPIRFFTILYKNKEEQISLAYKKRKKEKKKEKKKRQVLYLSIAAFSCFLHHCND